VGGRDDAGNAAHTPSNDTATRRPRCRRPTDGARTTEDDGVSLAVLETEPVAVSDALAESDPLALIEEEGETLLLGLMLPVGVPVPLPVCSQKKGAVHERSDGGTAWQGMGAEGRVATGGRPHRQPWRT
jgi:hypothetical protein